MSSSSRWNRVTTPVWILAMVGALCLLPVRPAQADPWADQVVSYAEGSTAQAGYTLPASALGTPARMTGADPWVGAVTPFNSPWLTDQIVSIGEGGHLTVRFDEPITDDPAHLYGVDLLIFSNGFFSDAAYPSGTVGGVFDTGPFAVSVSADGSNFVSLGTDFRNGIFPTLGYSDLTDPYATAPGGVASDFTKPVDPTLGLADLQAKTFAEIVALYDGSGGGIPFDIAGSGLSEVSYVRIDVPVGSPSPEIDAFVAVPEPATLGMLLVCLIPLRRRTCSRQR